MTSVIILRFYLPNHCYQMKAKKSSIIISKWTKSLLGPKNNYRLRYYHQRGHFPNLTHPQDMSEILINRLFDPIFCNNISKYVDKIKVRDYIRVKGLGNILLKHYGEWEKPEQINFDLLPNKFILKEQKIKSLLEKLI